MDFRMSRTRRRSTAASWIILFSGVLYTAPGCRADFFSFKGFFETFISSQHTEADLVKLGDLASDELPVASAEEIASLQPLITKYLEAPDSALRQAGLEVLFAISVRPDSAQLMSPYDALLIPYFESSDQRLKTFALMTLGKEYPHPSAGALAAFQIHLADGGNTRQQLIVIAGTLLSALPANDDVVRLVLKTLTLHPDYGAESEILQEFGLAHVRSEPALAFIHTAFKNPALRPAAIQAVGNMPRDVRNQFVTDLQSAVADKDLDASWQSAAAAVLRQP
jgi:hypothetical protein